MKAWKYDNTLRESTPVEDRDEYKEKLNNNAYEIIPDLENEVLESLKKNSDLMAKIFCKEVAEYIWNNYDIDELEESDLNGAVHGWLIHKLKKHYTKYYK